jgi:beta-aspartyl-peptidase (threonine type)
MIRLLALVIFPLAMLLGPGCASTASSGSGAGDTESRTSQPGSSGGAATARPGRWAIAIHGGAGTLDPATPPEKVAAYTATLEAALKLGADQLAQGKSALDVVESVVRMLEDDPKFNAGKGAVYTEIGTHELDASIMEGRTLACGSVAGVKTVKNPISLARLVMEKSGHVLLMSEGAEKFADAVGVERVPNTYFDTPERYEALQKKLEERRKKSSSAGTGDRGVAAASGSTPEEDPFAPTFEKGFGTVGCVALDARGDLAAATSTGGLTAKRFGRVGDTPIIGAGCFADNRSAAVSCTGTGEEFIRHTVARDIAALVEHKGWSAIQAAQFVVHERLAPDDGGVIVVSRSGEIAMIFNTSGMYRGAADSSGRFETAIFGR